MKTAAQSKSGAKVAQDANGVRTGRAPAVRRVARPGMELTPEQLAIRAQRGSPDAFGELVRQFEGRVFNFLLRRVSAADAEDLTQEAFIRAWQRIHQYDPRWRFSTWLFTIATRLTTSRTRKGRFTLGLDEHARGGTAVEPERRLAHAELRGHIWKLVDRTLTDEQRTAVWLRYVEDMAMQDIAQVMGKSQVGVRVMLHRARLSLARRMETEGSLSTLGMEVRVVHTAAGPAGVEP